MIISYRSVWWVYWFRASPPLLALHRHQNASCPTLANLSSVGLPHKWCNYIGTGRLLLLQ